MPAPPGARAGCRQQESRSARATLAGTRGRRASLPAQWRAPNRHGPVRLPLRPRYVILADWRSQQAARHRAICPISTRVPAPALRLTPSKPSYRPKRFSVPVAHCDPRSRRVTRPEQYALHPPPSPRHQREARPGQMLIILSACGVDQVNRGDIAFAAGCRCHTAEAADGQGPGRNRGQPTLQPQHRAQRRDCP